MRLFYDAEVAGELILKIKEAVDEEADFQKVTVLDVWYLLIFILFCLIPKMKYYYKTILKLQSY